MYLFSCRQNVMLPNKCFIFGVICMPGINKYKYMCKNPLDCIRNLFGSLSAPYCYLAFILLKDMKSVSKTII